jgi:hypothetical protein
VLLDVAALDRLTLGRALGQIEKGARLERDEERLVEYWVAINDGLAVLERCLVGVIEEQR